MRFPPAFLDELRARLPVSEVVGRRVKLKKAGREFKGLSPFNQERTPSFFANDQKGMWFDFSSGRNGNIFDFVMATDGVSFPEAVERLAGMAGLALPVVSKEVEAREERRKTLHDVLELAAKFFQATLAARVGAKARGYLADRGLDPAAQLNFRLGYAPAERYALKEHLGAHKVPTEDMVEAGLLVAGDDIPLPFDRFRDRVIFPITDLRDRVIGFGGRALEADVPAKYLNSPETPLFHKGSTLYNGAAARAAAHQGARVIAVEGYVDVIAMVGAGFTATVAPLGTALTEDQLGLIWRMADEPVLCFDGDSAGRRAAYRAVDLALPLLRPGKSLLFATLPEGNDPDDLVRSGGREAVDEVLAAARPLADMLWLRETETGGFDTPERRAALETRLGVVTDAISDESVRRYYRQDLEGRLRGLFSLAAPAAGERPRRNRGPLSGRAAAGFGKGGRGALSVGRNSGPSVTPREALRPLSPRLGVSALVRGHRSGLPPREALILMVVINHPWLLESHAEEFAELEFRHPDAERLRGALLDAAAHDGTDADTFAAAIAAGDLKAVVARVQATLTHTSDWPVQADAARADVDRWWAHVVTLHHKSRTLHRELRDAERALGSEPTEENLAWLKDVQERLAALDGTEAEIDGFGASSGRLARTV
jgi:DNA primase